MPIIKKGVVTTAGVHPGEVNSSWVVKGISKFLLSDSKEVKKLQKNFIFKLVPMLNTDGVIYGNNRKSLLGVDLNRRWNNPNEIIHSTIFYIKK